MSRVPYWLPSLRWGARMNHTEVLDALIGGLDDPFEGCHMGITAEMVAEEHDVSRGAQDAFAAESHRRAMEATAEGRFDAEKFTVSVPQRKGDAAHVTKVAHRLSRVEAAGNLDNAFLAHAEHEQVRFAVKQN